MPLIKFKKYLESIGNLPGRAGQHVWKPESPVLHDPVLDKNDKTISVKKNIDISKTYKPLYPAPLKPLSARDFGAVIKKVPKPKI